MHYLRQRKGAPLLPRGANQDKPPTGERWPWEWPRFWDGIVEMDNGVIIFGLLRDRHGGESAANELCAYAHDRGVKVIAGVGTSWYGGPYYEGAHPYNVRCYLTQHPERRAKRKNGEFRSAPSASTPKPGTRGRLRLWQDRRTGGATPIWRACQLERLTLTVIPAGQET